jgi:hypothetical protein
MSLRQRIVNRYLYGKPRGCVDETLPGFIARNAATNEPIVRLFGYRPPEWIEALAEARAWVRLNPQTVRLDNSMVTDWWIIQDMLPCAHCPDAIEEREGHWTHKHGRTRCQSPDVEYGHLAHPASVPCRADGPNPCLGASRA